jgi:hypothetical protein
MSRSTIQFNTGTPAALAPVKASSKMGSKYLNYLIKPEYQKLQKFFPNGKITIRVIPPIGEGAQTWSVTRRIIAPFGSKFKIIENDVFNKANEWFRANLKSHLLSKENERGYQLFPKTEAFILAIWFDEAQPKLGIFSSSYTVNSSSPIKQISDQSTLTEPNPGGEETLKYPSLVDPAAGRYITITKGEKGTKTPALVSIGTIDAPLKPLLDKLTDEEYNLLTNLDNIFHTPSKEEQLACLAEYIGQDKVKQIFG